MLILKKPSKKPIILEGIVNSIVDNSRHSFLEGDNIIIEFLIGNETKRVSVPPNKHEEFAGLGIDEGSSIKVAYDKHQNEAYWLCGGHAHENSSYNLPHKSEPDITERLHPHKKPKQKKVKSKKVAQKKPKKEYLVSKEYSANDSNDISLEGLSGEVYSIKETPILFSKYFSEDIVSKTRFPVGIGLFKDVLARLDKEGTVHDDGARRLYTLHYRDKKIVLTTRFDSTGTYHATDISVR